MKNPPRFAFAHANHRQVGKPHRIAIVGGGAGGLELAVRLGNDLGRAGKAEIVLVDPLPTHLWKPLLHELAAGTLAAEASGLDFLQQARRHRFLFHLGSMTALDRRRKEIVLAPLFDDEGSEIAPTRTLWYDTLVIAIGSRDNDFGIPGVREHALPLNGAADAQRFHRRLLALAARAEMADRGPVRVVIVGGGATGVELAAELADATAVIASYGERLTEYRQAVRLCLVETAPRLLAAVPEFVAATALEDLLRVGVEVRLGQRVTAVHADRISIADGEREESLPADIAVWAAGIRAPDVLADLDGLESNRLDQLVVTPTLQTTRDDSVFAIGDCASCIPAPGDAAVPPKAQAAEQESRLLARSLRRRLAGKTPLVFRFQDRGSLVSLGRTEAVGNLVGTFRGGVRVEGLLARLSYRLLYRRHLLTLLGVGQTLLAVVGSWISGRTQPKVKLH